MVNNKKLIAFAGVCLLLLGTVGSAWALNADYNRPTPLMDYVPQEIGIYDTMYPDLDEDACRSCHGASLADRHHNNEIVIRDRQCTPCHDIIEQLPGVLVFRDCVTDEASLGCHSWDNAQLGVNRWHHTTDLSGSENCTVCHDPNLVKEISAFRSFAEYPPSVVTPTPFSCENCHWEQAATAPAGGDPFDNTTKEHPLDKHHYNIWGQSIGYFEYGTDIKGNYDTHHMGFFGNVASQCAKCHSLDPNNLDWDPYNPELIRYCQVCHDVGTLHTLKTLDPGFPGGALQPHVGDYYAWEAVGFHAGGGDGIPTTYRKFNPDEQCFGCHADLIPDSPVLADCSGFTPSISTMTPQSGACYTYVTLTGVNFGVEQLEDSFVQMRLKPTAGNPWEPMPVYSWTDTQIEFEIPCWTLVPGNYQVRVSAACGNSAKVTFALKDWGTLLSVSPDQGPCGTTLTLTGSGFGGGQNVPTGTAGDTGIARFVKLVASSGQYLVKQYPSWSDTQVTAKFYNLSQDYNEDYLEDAPIKKCNGSVSSWLGSYEVYFVTVYYEESGTSGFDAGDTIMQVTLSDPELFELTAQPVIFRLNPDSIDPRTRLKVAGQNFGPYQTDGIIKVGSKAQWIGGTTAPILCRGKNCYKYPANIGELSTGGKVLDRNVLWSNTILKVKFKVPTKWRGKKKWIWIEKDGKISNASKILIN
jgi:hypothetical protein